MTDTAQQPPEVIDNGFLYVAQPPLYRVSTGKVTRYASQRCRTSAETAPGSVL